MNDFQQDFRLDDGVLHVRLSGKFPNDLLRPGTNYFQPLIDACSSQNCTRALIDARDLDVHLTTLDLFQAGKDAAAMSKLGLRVALLAREDMRDRFFEDVVYNSGGNMGMHTSMEAALDWLRPPPLVKR